MGVVSVEKYSQHKNTGGLECWQEGGASRRICFCPFYQYSLLLTALDYALFFTDVTGPLELSNSRGRAILHLLQDWADGPSRECGLALAGEMLTLMHPQWVRGGAHSG